MAGSDRLRIQLEDGLNRLGMPLRGEQVDALLSYLALIEKWSGAYNLTAITDPGRGITHHLLDSLSVAPHVHGTTLLDVGAGAGLPGVPLAIADRGLEVTLVDSSGKKVRFLNHVRRELGLDNITPVHARIEEHTAKTPPATITSRAFASLAETARLVGHLVGPETRVLAMKGRVPDDVNDPLPGGLKVDAVERLVVPDLHAERHLVIMCPTPS